MSVSDFLGGATSAFSSNICWSRAGWGPACSPGTAGPLAWGRNAGLGQRGVERKVVRHRRGALHTLNRAGDPGWHQTHPTQARSRGAKRWLALPSCPGWPPSHDPISCLPPAGCGRGHTPLHHHCLQPMGTDMSREQGDQRTDPSLHQGACPPCPPTPEPTLSPGIPLPWPADPHQLSSPRSGSRG